MASTDTVKEAEIRRVAEQIDIFISAKKKRVKNYLQYIFDTSCCILGECLNIIANLRPTLAIVKGWKICNGWKKLYFDIWTRSLQGSA